MELLPVTRAWLTFEWADHIGGDPAAIKNSSLRLHTLAGDAACDPTGIEGYIVFEFREACSWPRVAPGHRRIGISRQCPINGGSFPFAHGAASRFYKPVPCHVVRRQVEGRWARCFQNTVALVGTGNRRFAVPDLDEFAAGLDSWRTWIVPNGLLARSRFNGKFRSLAIIDDEPPLKQSGQTALRC